MTDAVLDRAKVLSGQIQSRSRLLGQRVETLDSELLSTRDGSDDELIAYINAKVGESHVLNVLGRTLEWVDESLRELDDLREFVRYFDSRSKGMSPSEAVSTANDMRDGLRAAASEYREA